MISIKDLILPRKLRIATMQAWKYHRLKEHDAAYKIIQTTESQHSRDSS